ncbi:MAG: flagellar biosynthetic protein FliO [Bacillota bacterium]
MDQEMFWAIVRLVIFLPVVTALAYFTVKYGLARRRWLFGTRRYMRVIEQLPFGPRAGISLVQVGREYFLIGFQDGRITLLKEFDQLPEELPATAWPGEDLWEKLGRTGGPGLLQKLFKEKRSHFRQKK